MESGLGYLLLGMALLLGVVCTMVFERIVEFVRDKRWLEQRANTRLNRQVQGDFRRNRELGQAASLFRDPRIEAALRLGDLPVARGIAEEGLRRAFESGNEDLARLYRDYLERMRG